MVMETFFADMPHMRKLIANPRFLSKFYSPSEMKFLMAKNFSPYITAEMFCAKVAFKKAMGVSFRNCSLREVSVLADYNGYYYFSLSGNAKKYFQVKKVRANVSCAHSKTLAMSTVIFYEQGSLQAH